MKKVKIDDVYTKDLILYVAELADEIWNEYYSQIISKEQIDYMLDKYQSEETIGSQIISGSHYYLISVDGEYVGYLSLKPNKEDHTLFLSKIYILKEWRGKGLGSYLFNFANDKAREWKCDKVWLTVNRENDSVDVYKKRGFYIATEADTHIGNGFYMNDYIMEYVVK